MILILGLIFIPMLCAPVAYVIGRKKEKATEPFAMVVTAAELLACMCLLSGWGRDFTLQGGISVSLSFTTRHFHCAYALIGAFMWAMTTFFAREYFQKEREHIGRYWMFLLLTLGATEGVMLSADFMTAFIFFEILSFTSFTWVIHEETKEAITAAYTYLFIAVFGGMVLFMGLALLQKGAGTLVFEALPQALAVSDHPLMVRGAGFCILLGFGAKAGMFPLHIWLPMAHPVAPSPASALLSGILTKVGIYGILMTALYVLPRDSAFGVVVLVLGLITMVIGAVMALVSVNLKRTLACSSMSQIGFILTGIAMLVLFESAGEKEGAENALTGLTLHMVNHSLIKLTLFCAAGVVVMRCHTLVLDEIRGWGRNKTLLKIAFALGALGISGVPLFNGYLSKTLLHEAIAEGAACFGGFSQPLGALLKVSEWIFLGSGGLTFAYMLKLFICIFAERNKDAKRQAEFDVRSNYMSPLSGVVIFGSSLLMPILGQPFVSSAIAGYMTEQEVSLNYAGAFSWDSLQGGLISLGFGLIIYLVIVRKVLIKGGSYCTVRQLLSGEKEDGRHTKDGKRGGLNAGLFIVTEFFRIIDMGMDAPLQLLKIFLTKEQKKEDRHTQVYGFFGGALTGKRGEEHPIAGGFSFALMMTCIGILIILYFTIR